MAENSSPNSLSRRAFFRRLKGGARSDDKRNTDMHSVSAVDEGEGSDEGGSETKQALSPAEARRQLKTLGVTVMPLSEEEEQLQVQCKRVGNQFGQEQMKLLEPIAPRVAWLDLARTGIKDPALEIVGKMVELRRLYLQNTTVEGSGLTFLTDLEQLEYLNLFGTKVDDSALDHLKKIECLRTVYLSRTNVSTKGVQELRQQRRDLSVDFEDSFPEE